ncbi:MAG TPA: FAD-dependent oxidoreductase [Rhizomicrobium sp.]|nr:FAD-dependent oxidoreductase [Rhizomicrobium sp.]
MPARVRAPAADPSPHLTIDQHDMPERIIIIGAGQAGAQAVATLRAEGFTGALTLVGDEPFPPYQRPPLSKAYLAGTFERERLFLKPSAFYAEAGCEMILGIAATRIDRQAQTIALADGRTFAYDKLLLATGSRVRRIPVAGAGLDGTFYLRGIADVDALRAAFARGKRLAVVGGGYIGLEVAAVAIKHGLDVTVFESLDRVMARAVSPAISSFYEQVHRNAGVQFALNRSVEAFEGELKLASVRAGGRSHPADIALVGIGILPNVELAKEAGLACDDGVMVDDCARTADPAIFSAGDCTRHLGRDGALIRLESVQNAIDQAKHAALAMLGRPTSYREVPWFWSDQYDLKLQIAGLAREGDELVLRGDPAARKFAVFHLRDGRVAAVEAVNAAPEYIVGRKLIAEGAAVAAARLADAAIPMKSVA